MLKRKKSGIVNFTFITIIVISTVLFLAKDLTISAISIADEMHQLAVSHRFYMGDAVIVDDWTPEQLNGVLILPLVSIFTFITGGTEGLTFFMRCSVNLIKLAVVLYGFIKYKNYAKKGAMYALLLMFYAYSPYNLDTTTYQMMPLINLMVCLIVLSTESNNFEYVIAGVCFAATVLSQPFFSVGYIFVLTYIVVRWNGFSNKSKKNVIAFHIGLITLFILFCIFMFSRAGLREIYHNLPHIFGEQDHDMLEAGIGGIFYNNVVLVLWEMIVQNKVTTYMNAIFIAVLAIFNKKRDELKPGVIICLVVSIASMFFEEKIFLMNEIMIPFMWLSIEILFFLDKKDIGKYICYQVMAWTFVLATAIGTNTGVFATAGAMFAIGMVDMLYLPLNETKMAKILFGISMIFAITTTIVCRCLFMWWGDKISLEDYKHKILDGPMKGMYAADAEYTEYYKIWNDVQTLGLVENDVLFCGTSTPLAYLIGQVSYGTMGTPFFTLDYGRLENYWAMHPYKYPTVIYYNIGVIDQTTPVYWWMNDNYNIEYYDDAIIARLK